MDLITISAKVGDLIHHEAIGADILQVRESAYYRWFHFGGDIVQSIIDITKPASILLPVPQAMLIFLLWRPTPNKVLNLGMGAGTFERFFQNFATVKLTSVEAQLAIIDMAKKYFLLSTEHEILHQSAEDYLQQNQHYFDAILCDIFHEEQSPACLFDRIFFRCLHQSLSPDGIVSLNLLLTDKEKVIKILTVVTEFFDHVAMIDFDHYQNVVLLLSNEPLPSQKTLCQLNKQMSSKITIDFDDIINHLFYVPTR